MFSSALEVLLLGVSALQHFVRLNWTGPDDPSSVCCPEMLQDTEGLTTELALDAEDVYSVLRGPQWLLLARTVLVNSPEIFSKHQVSFVFEQYLQYRHCFTKKKYHYLKVQTSVSKFALQIRK